MERHIVFPFNWHWGHIYQIGNNVISNWEKGECYAWPIFRYHLAANAGIKDLYLLAVRDQEMIPEKYHSFADTNNGLSARPCFIPEIVESLEESLAKDYLFKDNILMNT